MKYKFLYIFFISNISTIKTHGLNQGFYLLKSAQKLNADAVLNVRFTTSVIAQGTSEILAYGTAVSLK